MVSIPGYNVHKIDRNRYMVSVNNGNMGAAIISKDQLKNLAESKGVKLKENNGAKIAGALLATAAVTTAVVYRKDIGKYLKTLKNGKVGEVLNDLKTKAEPVAKPVQEAVSNGAKSVKKGLAKGYDAVAEFASNAWAKTKDFFVGLFRKVFPKKEKFVQGELFPIEKTSDKVIKKAKEFGAKASEFFKNVGKNVKKLFTPEKPLYDETIFGKGMSAESEKIRRNCIAEMAKNATLRPSGLTKRDWQSDLAKKYGAMNVH